MQDQELKKFKRFKRWKIVIELTMTILGIVGSFATVPQIIKIYITHTEHVHGQSLVTWSAYAFIAFLWILYGIYFKRKAVSLTNLLYFIMYLIITVGVIIHSGFHW